MVCRCKVDSDQASGWWLISGRTSKDTGNSPFSEFLQTRNGESGYQVGGELNSLPALDAYCNKESTV